jgi:hypothetical protein
MPKKQLPNDHSLDADETLRHADLQATVLLCPVESTSTDHLKLTPPVVPLTLAAPTELLRMFSMAETESLFSS